MTRALTAKQEHVLRAALERYLLDCQDDGDLRTARTVQSLIRSHLRRRTPARRRRAAFSPGTVRAMLERTA